ncbi:MAG: hypothetical protein CMH93_01530 [Oceanicaulis sp.]|nr:hypothetical protein [Oceanicaulis sp.]|tara:strand:+ start:943 stop:1398 length:456 start_codon:yes stop_codon:yes gene_type:complete
MPELVLQRLEHDDRATLGELMLDGRRLCYTLENRPPRQPGVKEPGDSRIPAGDWALGLREEGGFYNRHRARWPWHGPMVEILLPGWQWVLFHTGNYHTDTAGCVLTGESYGDSDRGLAVWQSRVAYVRVYPELLDLARQGGRLIVRDEVAG